MPVPAGSYNLSTVYKLLGLRDPRVIPQLSEDGRLQGSINLGNLDTLVSEIIEARSIVFFANTAGIAVGEWEGCSMLSVAPGGSIVEFLSVDAISQNPADEVFYRVNLAPVQAPFVPASTITPLSMGGQPLSNLWTRSAVSVGAPPQGNTMDGFTQGGSRTTASREGLLYTRLWIPPSWSFWVTVRRIAGEDSDPWAISIRVREVPQALGAA